MSNAGLGDSHVISHFLFLVLSFYEFCCKYHKLILKVLF